VRLAEPRAEDVLLAVRLGAEATATRLSCAATECVWRPDRPAAAASGPSPQGDPFDAPAVLAEWSRAALEAAFGEDPDEVARDWLIHVGATAAPFQVRGDVRPAVRALRVTLVPLGRGGGR